MAGVAKRDCPYCHTKDVAFTAVIEWVTKSKSRRALFTCGSCEEGVIWEFSGPNNSVMQLGGNIEFFKMILGEQWPVEESGEAPEDTPASVARYFEQGTSSLRSGNFDAAGMMFRKTLETATKILDEALAKKPLVARIDDLAKKGKLTPDLAQWAHEVRLGGNDAAHEEEPFSSEDAESLRNFIENFLRYAFTLPSAVRRRSKPEVIDS